MAKGYKTGGRTPGSKNLKTREREDRTAKAVAAVAASVLEVNEDATRLEKIGKAAGSAREAKPDIAPKELLLAAMRDAWAESCRLSWEADLLEPAAAAAESEARDAIVKASSGGSCTAAIRDLKVETATALRANVDAVRAKARAALIDATGWAKDVAPYQHPKLTPQNGAADQTLNITILKFSGSERHHPPERLGPAPTPAETP